jgi:hypothetical protein
MTPPDPILLYKAGLQSAGQIAALWHLAQCGVTGALTHQVAEAIDASPRTAYGLLNHLANRRLVVPNPLEDRSGNPIQWIISRLGYRLMTGHLTTAEKPAGQKEIASIAHA